MVNLSLLLTLFYITFQHPRKSARKHWNKWVNVSMRGVFNEVLMKLSSGFWTLPLPPPILSTHMYAFGLPKSITKKHYRSILANPTPTPTPPLHTHTHDPFSKKCNIWYYKGYTDKNEKQVGCYVNLDGVKTCPDALDHWYTLSNLFVILIMYLFFLHFVLQMRFYMVMKSIHLFLFQNFRYQTLYNKN